MKRFAPSLTHSAICRRRSLVELFSQKYKHTNKPTHTIERKQSVTEESKGEILLTLWTTLRV